jgi:hypothetical protein
LHRGCWARRCEFCRPGERRSPLRVIYRSRHAVRRAGWRRSRNPPLERTAAISNLQWGCTTCRVGRRGLRLRLQPSHGLMFNNRPAILPTSCKNHAPDGLDLVWSGLSTPIAKNILIFRNPKSLLYSMPSRPTQGAYRDRHGRGMRCGGRGSVGRAMGSQGGLLSVSDFRHAGRTAHVRTAKACGPGTRCWCQVGGGVASPTGFDDALIRRRRWQKELVTEESAL